MAKKVTKEVTKEDESIDYNKYIKEHYVSVHKSKVTNPRTLTLVALPDNNEIVTTFNSLEATTNTAMCTIFGRSVWETKVWVIPVKKPFSNNYEFMIYATVMFQSKEAADNAYKQLKELLDE
jgi:hypothetical protein